MTTARDQALRNAMAEMDHAQATADLLDSLQRGSAMTVEEISEEDFLAWEEVQPPIPNRLLRPQGRKHMVIGDTQQKPRADRRILRWLGQYAVEQKPDVIVHMGDHWDMAGLSYYDRGTRAGEGGRYWYDIHAGNIAMKEFLAPLYEEYHRSGYWPQEMHFLLGNHEYRIVRWLNSEPALAGTLGYKDFLLDEWSVHDFLEPVIIDGVKYSHFFPRSANGKIVQTKRGAPSARLQVQREGMSATAGHTQGLDTHIQPAGHVQRRGVICGSCYLHEEEYMKRGGGNRHWVGCLIKHNVFLGDYDLMEVGVDYLAATYDPEFYEAHTPKRKAARKIVSKPKNAPKKKRATRKKAARRKK